MNVYFLVNSLSIRHDSFSEYYSRVPNIVNDKMFSDILYDIQVELLPNYIKMLCSLTNASTFAKLIKSIPEEVQEMFIEAAITAEKQKIGTNQITRKLILEYFTNYIHQFDNVWVSSRLRDKDILRCLEKDEWEDCANEYGDKLEQRKVQRKHGLETNPWGYYGKYNPETKTFSIVNVVAQLEKHKKSREDKLAKLNNLVKKGVMTEDERDTEIEKIDYRNEFSGLRCTSWSVQSLLNIGIRILKLDYPASFKSNESDSGLRKLVRKNKNLTIMYTENDIQKLTNDQLRRALFYVSQTSKRKHLCTEIEKWMKKNSMARI